MMVGDAGDCSGNVMYGYELHLHDGLLVDMMKT